MTDLLERLAAANPVSEVRRPPIEDVWRKVAEAPAPARPGWRRTGRWLAAVLAVAVPVGAVVVIALSLGGARPHASRPAAPGTHVTGSMLDPAAQRVADQQLKGRTGSIVVLNPRTGAIEALAGTAHARAQTLLPPAATFDVVTAAAALDSGRYTPASRIPGGSPLHVSGSLVSNDNGQRFGRITLTDALSGSVNTVFARVGDELGPATMTTYMKRFGFYSPGFDHLPASGARAAGVLALPTSGRVALGPLAAGEGGLTATSVQMAMMAAAVANGGTLVSPHLTTATSPVPERRVMSPTTAHALAQMLRRAVTRGTGTAADLDGLQIAGKTGTAPVIGSRETVASFIAFAPADHPTVAVAVVLRDAHGGFGGTEAAPVAARVIRAVLSERP
jgi:peptidoglycan glycosyltransferase